MTTRATPIPASRALPCAPAATAAASAQRQAQRGADPGELPGGFVREGVGVFAVFVAGVVVAVPVFVLAAVLRVAFGQIMVVKVEKALDEEHRQKTAEQPVHGLIQ
jgi:hypothetical protein